MAFYEFNGSASQNQQVRQLKSSLLTARELAARIKAQNAQMTLAQMQAQFGVDTNLTEVRWENVIINIDAALAAAAITSLTDQVGFTS